MAAPQSPGKTLAIAGAATAAANAGELWVDQATTLARAFLTHIVADGSKFQIRHVRAWAEARGLSSPPDARAWGHIARRLKTAGLIAPAGFGHSVDPRQHNGIVNEWRVSNVKH